MNQFRNIIIYLILSFLAAVFIYTLIITSPSETPSLWIYEKGVIASIFIISCVIGISCTFRPNWIQRYFFQKKKSVKDINKDVKRVFQGHHPDCPIFQNHRIQWKNRILCAGCLGLLIGLCISIILMILYLILVDKQLKIISYELFIAGLFILCFVYVENFYSNRRPLFHVFSNILFPLSFFMIIIAVNEVTGNLIYDLFTILLCFLWLDVRIQLSNWRHSKLCLNCIEFCKMYYNDI